MGRFTRSLEFCMMIAGFLNGGAMVVQSVDLVKAMSSTSDQLTAYFFYTLFWIALLEWAMIGRIENKPLVWSMAISTIATGFVFFLILLYR